MTLIEIDALDATELPDLADFTGLTDVALRTRTEPENGLYIAESSNVIRRALTAGHTPKALLMAPKWVESMRDVIADLPPTTPVYVAPEPVLEEITGFHLHRGAIASMHRPDLLAPAELLDRYAPEGAPRRIAIFEDLVDHTNLGAAFRSAAALGVDGVFVTPRCADPLYRRSVRVSMGAVFQVPWTRLTHWPLTPRRAAAAGDDVVGGVELLRERGFTVAALALDDTAVSLDALEGDLPDRLALILGNEGAGLVPRTVAAADLVVKIPMAGDVDSLNVAAAAAVAFWATRPR